MNATDQSIIRTLGPEAEGVLSAGHFCEGRDDAANKKFVADYEKAFGKMPSIYAFSHYSGAMWLAQAFEAIGGKVEDRPRFLEAVRKIKLSASPLGREVSLDKYGNPVYDIYIRKVTRRADGKLWNVPVEVYQGVSQFWKYDPEQYMKQPPYSREFQGIKKA
jgi:branched-chain amino acid transport system substrate-binding protein